MQPRKVVKVAKVSSGWETPALDTVAALCYFYPQYKLAEARRLPHKHVMRLMRIARKEQAKKYYNLTQIAAAPQTNKGSGVKKLTKHFEDIMRNG